MKKTKDVPKARRRWVEVNLQGSRFHNVDLTGSKIRGAFLVDVELDGVVKGLTVNGVDVSRYVEKELDERYPVRPSIRAGGPDDLRHAWGELEAMWAATTERVVGLGDAVATERVDDEWSFVETLRHLVFVTDAWFRRCVLADAGAYATIGLPITDLPPWLVAACGVDIEASPTLAEVLEVRAERQVEVREFLAAATDEHLAAPCPRTPAKGFPRDPTAFIVRSCLQTVLREELAHHRFAVRDIDHLDAGTA